MSAPVVLVAEASVRDAAILLARTGALVLPVVSTDGTYLGAFGEADVHRRLSEVTRGFHSPEEFRTGVPFLGARLPEPIWVEFARLGWTPVGGLARKVPPVAPRDRVVAAVETMRRWSLPAVPVVAAGRPVGILHADALTLKLVEFALAPASGRSRPTLPVRAVESTESRAAGRPHRTRSAQ